jgi:TonB-linked SusC/RagA family outer membrane protein
MFPSQLVDDAKPVTIILKNASIEETLVRICENQRFSYTIKDKAILLLSKVLQRNNANVVVEKGGDIKGKVTDSDGKPLTGATVIVVGRPNQGTSTNDNGEFFLNNVPEVGKLLFRMIGYGSKEVPYERDANLHIVLNQLETDINEVQIIGYGAIPRKLNTGNVGSVRAEEIERQPVNNPLLALQGRIAGVEVTPVSGVSGNRINVRIRGTNSIDQSREPLYVVDGTPYTTSLYNTQGYGGINSRVLDLSPLSLINSNDIESIDVLKDADATAIYGSRGANGVVLITTKKGKPGLTKLDLNIQSGFGEVAQRALLMNTQQYLMMRREAFKNDNFTPTAENAKDLMVWDQNAFTDWQEELIGGTSAYRNGQLTISGGNENTQFLIGGNYHYETTVFPGDWNDSKSNVHFNLNNTSTNRKFKVMFSGSYLFDNNQLPMTDYTQYINTAPNAPSFYKEDGDLNWDDFSLNPFRDRETRFFAKVSNLLGNGVVSYQVFPGLQIKTNLGFNNILTDEQFSAPIASNSPASGIKTGSARFSRSQFRSSIIEPQLNYVRTLGKATLNILAGGTLQDRHVDGQVTDGEGYTDDGLLGSLAGASTISKGETANEQYRYVSVFTRLNLNWMDRYILNFTGRRDGSSRFGSGKRYGNFCALGAAWLFSNEPIVRKLLPVLSFGKLRASYGTSGNEPANNYAFLELYNISNSLPYGGGSGISPNNLYVPDFRWEQNKKLEGGLELGVFENRVNITASYYHNISSNQLVTRPLPGSVGFPGAIANLPAKVSNQGWELTLASTNIKRGNFEWTSSLNLTTSKNKLESFPNFEKSSYRFSYILGQPLGARRLYHSAGLEPKTGLYQFYDTDGNAISEPSPLTDMTGIANLSPKYFGGFHNSLRYSNISLDFTFQFVKQLGENYLFRNANPPGFFSSNTGAGNQPVELLDRWTNEGSNGRYQRFTQTIEGLLAYTNIASSKLAFSDASFIRLKNVSISYQVTSDICKKIGLRTLRFYIHTQNLFTISRYKGVDPETQSLNTLPPLRVITGGLQVTL